MENIADNRTNGPRNVLGLQKKAINRKNGVLKGKEEKKSEKEKKENTKNLRTRKNCSFHIKDLVQ